MKNQLSPAMVAIVLGVVLVVVVVIGYKMLVPAGFKADKTGSEQAIQKVNQGQKFYSPPEGAPIPGRPGSTGVQAGPPGMAPMTGPGGAGVPTGPPR